METAVKLFEQKTVSILWGMIFFTMITGFGVLANQQFSFVLLFFLSALGLPWLAEPKPPYSLFILRHQSWKIIFLGSCIALGTAYFLLYIIITGYLKAIFIHPTLHGSIRFLLDRIRVVLPLALAEEFFFRGYLQETVFRGLWGKKALGPLSYNNMATSLLFGLAHMITGFSLFGLLKVFSGLGLGWLMERSKGSLWPVIALHALGNMMIGWIKLLVGLNIPWL